MLALGVVVIASLSYAQGFIGLHSDVVTYDCRLSDTAPSLCPVYMVQHFVQGISSEFRIDASHSFLFNTGILWNVPVVVVPDGQTLFSAGASLGYGECAVPPVLLGTLNYFCQGTSSPCDYLEAVPHIQNTEILIADCTLPSPNVMIAFGGLLTINDTGYCDPWKRCLPLPVQETSWGQIKALYQE